MGARPGKDMNRTVPESSSARANDSQRQGKDEQDVVQYGQALHIKRF